jgi:hypothetical protein
MEGTSQPAERRQITKGENMYTTLTGHTDAESAYMVDDYPYGFRLRTQIRYWIETTKHGQRFVSQTLNPKTGAWNKPKAGTYDVIKVMVRNEENGHIEHVRLDWNDNEEKIAAFEVEHAAALDDRARSAIKQIRAHNRAMSKLTWTIEPAQDGKVYQTRDEQMAIIDALTRAELAKDG